MTLLYNLDSLSTEKENHIVPPCTPDTLWCCLTFVIVFDHLAKVLYCSIPPSITENVAVGWPPWPSEEVQKKELVSNLEMTYNNKRNFVYSGKRKKKNTQKLERQEKKINNFVSQVIAKKSRKTLLQWKK